jgi:dTDP-4-amino-4,6-dideoxygalactose transaminase
MSISDTVRHSAREVIYETYPELGYNYRMTDLQAAIGREQLRRLPKIVARRRVLAERYAGALATSNGLRLPIEPEWARSNWQSFCVGLPEGVGQRAVMQYMLDRGISTRRGIMNAHTEAAYAGRGSYRNGSDLRRSIEAQERAVILPLFVQMSEADIDFVAETLTEAVATSSSRKREVA